MKTTSPSVLAMLVPLCLSTAAIADQSLPTITNTKDILMAGFKTQNKYEEAYLEGELAETIRHSIKKPGTTIIVRATPLGFVAGRKDCKTIGLNFITPDASFQTADSPKAPRKPLDIGMKFNVCANGRLLNDED